MEKKKIRLVGKVLLDGKIFVSVGKIYCCCKVKSDECPGCSVEMCRVIHNFRTHVNVQIGHTRVRRSTSSVLMIALQAVQMISFSRPSNLLLDC